MTSKEPSERKAPAFQFYADDFLAGTMDMDDAEVGAYIRMLCVQWTKGGVDPKRSCRLSDPDVVAHVLGTKFEAGKDGLFRNARLESVRDIQQKRKESGSKGGSKTQANHQANGQAKHQANSQANGQAKVKPPSPSPTTTPSPVPGPFPTPENPGAPATGVADAFERFWLVVHLKKGKDAAKKAFERACKRKGPVGDLTAADYIIDAMREFAASPEASPTDHSPIHPATWLNQGRYDDDRDTWRGGSGAGGDVF